MPDKPSSLKHELRTPLNHILGYTEMLLEESEDRGQTPLIADLRRIHAAGLQLLTVIDDLFDPHKATPLNESTLHHELRTPLNQIIGYAEILQDEAMEMGHADSASDIQKIHQAARRLLNLVIEELIPAHVAGPGDMTSPQVTGATSMFTRKSEELTHATGMPDSPEGDKILVVDDNALNRDMLTRRLQRLGFRVDQAGDGREALQAIRECSYDLVLLDILMPEMNGYQVLEQLNGDPVLRSVPVIVISAAGQDENVARCIELGAEDYLRKPFNPVILQARINASLEKKHLRDREVSYLKQIEQEKKRSDELLHVILPDDIATELKQTNGVKPQRFDSVAVLFCDICNFTSFCDQHPPEQVLGLLQSLVESYELLTLQHQLEKIKTIGDSFMATAGLTTSPERPALQCVRCGLAMIAVAETLPPHWQVRIGISIGPVVAGVVGHRKYQYDVWGDTVNLAARMESLAHPGSICVPAQTWEILAEDCHGRSLGKIPVKGKGELEIFEITALR